MNIFNYLKKSFSDQEVVQKNTQNILTEYDNSYHVSQEYVDRQIYTTSLTHDKMWDCYQQNEWVRACINAIVNECVKYQLVVRPRKGIKLTPELEKQMEMVNELLENPNKRIESFDTIRRKYLKDVLIYDAGALEIVYKSSTEKKLKAKLKKAKKSNDTDLVKQITDKLEKVKSKKENEDVPKEIYDLDGSKIKINADKHGNFKNDETAYKLVKDQRIIAEFSTRELIYFMAHPRAGGLYGTSPLDTLIYTVTSDNEANDMNRMRLSRDGMISGLLIMPGLSKTEAQKTVSFWKAEGRKHGWKLGITSHEKANFIKISESNRDMEFMELQRWYKSKIMAVYGVTPIILGDIDSTTGKLNSKEQREQFKTNALLPLLTLEAYRLTDVLLKAGFKYEDLEFGHIEPENMDPEMDLKKAEIVAKLDRVVTVNELRKLIGLQPLTSDEEKEFEARGNELFSPASFAQLKALASKSQEQDKVKDLLDKIEGIWDEEESIAEQPLEEHE